MTDQAKPLSRPWRRFLRFSVRGMIVAVLLMGGWLGWIVRSARIQREAVAAIVNGWGVVLYDWECENRMGTPRGKPWAPAWLVELLGVDYFGHVAVVQLRMPLLTNLSDTHVTDAGLLHLKGANVGRDAIPLRMRYHRRPACALERLDQTLETKPQRHARHRRRPGAFRVADRPLETGPRRNSSFRRRNRASEATVQPIET